MRTSSLACLLILAAAMPAAAQSIGGKPKIVGTTQSKPREEPPPAVPGARARPGTVAPAERGAADLPPTEALFDAINRGDIATARDAVNRGADIDGTNVLGLTPLELSVDLNRNDITFLLLSFRGGGGTGSRQALTAPGQTRADKPRQSAPIRNARAAPATPGVAARESTGPIRQTPALFAGNGGAAVPSAGFLGFDAKR